MIPGIGVSEACDTGIDDSSCNGNNNGQGGPGRCQKPSCGDGYTNTTSRVPGTAIGSGADLFEQCDDSSENSNVPNACRPNCQLPVCGDGVVDNGSHGDIIFGEQCDFANNIETCPAGQVCGSIGVNRCRCIALPPITGGID